MILGRVICTCYAGYRFNQDLHRQSAQRSLISGNMVDESNFFNATNATENVGIVKACEDIDECNNGQNDCEQVSQIFTYRDDKISLLFASIFLRNMHLFDIRLAGLYQFSRLIFLLLQFWIFT